MPSKTQSIAHTLLSWSEGSAFASMIIAVAALLILGYVDLVSGHELNLVLFYVFPIMLATWAAGRRAGLVMAAFAATLWLWVDKVGGHDYDITSGPYWNAAMRLGVFLLIVQLVLLLRQRLEAERILSLTDPLTGIANRRAFTDALNREMVVSKRSGASFSLAFVDVDRFKRLNDRRGHTEGDRALTRIASALKASLREVDLVARMGGDEFPSSCQAPTALRHTRSWTVVSNPALLSLSRKIGGLASAPASARLSVPA